MRRHYRAFALAISLGVATVASAQSNNTNTNPAARDPGGDIFFYSPLDRSRNGSGLGNAFDASPSRRPAPRAAQPPVTPVPEPSQWAMMLAGLVLVGFIVRRNTKR
ncbi:MAG TPA: PEPxxWA-CTERM sorting domain-containing protein [Myxococcota bacterium]|nr:PEPxxWA-CTERM sorting domain-containing protein [Myxococcota bacterium]